ncbi:MAG TPA: DoxX family protein [Pyrinomonadaceae bacterium]
MSEVSSASTAIRWTGYVMTILPSLFLLFDGVMKLFKPRFVVEATMQLGYQESAIIPIGVILVICTVLYLIPVTSVLGAILLTGYLGGAVATHVRAGQGSFPVIFPVIIGVLIWAGLYFRDHRLRNLIPLSTTA